MYAESNLDNLDKKDRRQSTHVPALETGSQNTMGEILQQGQRRESGSSPVLEEQVDAPLDPQKAVNHVMDTEELFEEDQQVVGKEYGVVVGQSSEKRHARDRDTFIPKLTVQSDDSDGGKQMKRGTLIPSISQALNRLENQSTRRRHIGAMPNHVVTKSGWDNYEDVISSVTAIKSGLNDNKVYVAGTSATEMLAPQRHPAHERLWGWTKDEEDGFVEALTSLVKNGRFLKIVILEGDADARNYRAVDPQTCWEELWDRQTSNRTIAILDEKGTQLAPKIRRTVAAVQNRD